MERLTRRFAFAVTLLVAVGAGALGATPASAARIIKETNLENEFQPGSVSSNGTDVFVAEGGDHGVILTEVEASTGNIIRKIETDFKYNYREPRVSVDREHAWLTIPEEDLVVEIDPSTGSVVRTIPLGGEPSDVSSDGTDVWVTEETGQVVELEASTGSVVRTIPVGGAPDGVSSDGTYVWVANATSESISEIEAATGAVIRTIPVGESTQDVASNGTDVWVTHESGLTQIEAATGAVVRTVSMSQASHISADSKYVWVFDHQSVTQLNASSGAVINSIYIGDPPGWVSSDGTHVWVTNFYSSTLEDIQISLPAAECTADAGTIKLAPGLTDTPTVQTVTFKAKLHDCVGKVFTEAAVTATLKTTSPVSCAALSEGELATGTATYKWKPRANPVTSSGPLSITLSQAPSSAFFGELTAGLYSPFEVAGNASETYKDASKCGVGSARIRAGTFSSASFAFE